MKRVQNVTAANFGREVLFSPVPMVVDVYADWCGPCRALAPLLEKCAELDADEVKFVKVNLKACPVERSLRLVDRKYETRTRPEE